DDEGNVVETWVSGTEPYFIEAVLVAGKTYTLVEEIAPDGYVIAETITFTVSTDGSIDEVVMEDDTTKVSISKQDITNGEELPGATLTIYDDEGNVVETWVSGTEPYFIEAVLVAGKTYTLVEEIAPDGYVIAETITFTVSTDGTIDTVVMLDDTTKVTISKRASGSRRELPGAKLAILDPDGNIIDQWTTTKTAREIEGVLKVGVTYTLKEIEAPEGYKRARPITFTVNDDGSNTLVILRNRLLVESELPKTGDGNDLGLWIALMGISLASLGATAVAARKRSRAK
ncbi:MAG: MSCRAMM family protein, partial [Christensenellales bacterium]